MRRYLFGLILILSISNALAQSISFSPYSVYGIGVLKERTSAHNRALSETGIGIRDDYNLNTLNPASYTSVHAVTQISEIGMFYEWDWIKTSELSQKSSAGNLSAINLWFRFSKKWGGTIGLAPFSTIKYDIRTSRDFGEADDTSIRFSGQGGLTQFYLGNGFQITKNLSVGFNAAYIFGNIKKEETILTGQSAGLALEKKTILNGPTLDFGTQYTFFLPKDRTVTLGATLSSKIRLNTSRSVHVYEVNGQDSLYLKEESIDDFTLPSQLGTGISFQTPKHLIAMDLKVKNWKEANLGERLHLQNTTRFSAAYEYKGNPLSTSYLKSVALRSSFYVQNNYVSPNGTTLNEWGFSMGAGFPLSGNRATLNVSYNFNQNGSTQNNLILQQGNVLVLDFVFRDLWGIRRKFD